MSRRGSSVDFGPLSLPVGDMPMFEDFGASLASLKDVEKLHQLLSQQRGQEQREKLIPTERADIALYGMDLHQTHILASLAELLPRVATPTTTKTQAQAVISMSSDVLADTRLTVTDTGLRIEFSFQIGDDRQRHWLQQHLAWLARTVGERLARDVRICVANHWASGPFVAIQDWQYGTGA